MKADQIRNLYEYHFALNRKVWDEAVSQLSDDQFVQDMGYSVGSVRNQIVHMIDTDLRWFSGLIGEEPPGFSNPVYFGKQRGKVLAYRQETDAMMQKILDGLDDEAVNAPYDTLIAWQVLVHVVTHSIDHRAQLLAMLNQFGVETFAQDYALYLFGRI